MIHNLNFQLPRGARCLLLGANGMVMLSPPTQLHPGDHAGPLCMLDRRRENNILEDLRWQAHGVSRCGPCTRAPALP